MSEPHTLPEASTEGHYEPELYEIRVKGHLDDRWADWFGGLTITLQEDGDTLLTGPVVDQAALFGFLRKVQKSLSKDVQLKTVYSRTALVDQVLRTVRNNLLEGALLVIAILFIFLGNLRAGLIVALAIPLSMLFAFNAMLKFGIAGSLMSLGAIDFGLVVDSSVIMVENAVRHVDENKNNQNWFRVFCI